MMDDVEVVTFAENGRIWYAPPCVADDDYSTIAWAKGRRRAGLTPRGDITAVVLPFNDAIREVAND